MQTVFEYPGYSAEVDFWLDCQHGRFPLRQVSDTFVIMAAPQTIPACRASIVLWIDGEKFERQVKVVAGPHSHEVMILSDDEHAPF